MIGRRIVAINSKSKAQMLNQASASAHPSLRFAELRRASADRQNPNFKYSDFPFAVCIKKTRKETALVTSFVFDYPARAKPGQFVNVWLTGFGEKPMSIAFDDGKSYTISVAAVGGMTVELARKKAGDFIGVRGPYGTHFTWRPRQRIAMLAGGYGASPLYFAAHKAAKDGCEIDFYFGARCAERLFLTDKIKKLPHLRFLPATNDGSAGHKGTNVELWLKQMKSGVKYDAVMACGPELMTKAVSDTAWKRKMPAQISVERYMKCGFGVCGSCCVDDLGITTCQNGPVMDNSVVRKIKEFGVYHRGSTGQKQYFGLR